MARTRHLIAAAIAGLALAAAGCDSDNSEDEPASTSGNTTNSPVDPGSPGLTQGETTPAPEESERPETGESP